MKTPELKNREQQFWHHLRTRAKYAKGWDVQSVQRKNEHTRVRFTCLHGRRHDERILLADLEGFMANPKGLADQYFRRAIKWCKGEHVDISPHTWYSTGPPKIGQLTSVFSSSVQWITLPDNWTSMGTITWNPPDFTNMVYGGGGTKSIVGELLDICPGLGKVQRPCPECKAEPAYLTALIPHVNDTHKWSREKIAEWLDIISMDDPTVDFTIQPKEKKREQPSIISPSIFKAYEELIVKYSGAFTIDNTNLIKEILGGSS